MHSKLAVTLWNFKGGLPSLSLSLRLPRLLVSVYSLLTSMNNRISLMPSDSQIRSFPRSKSEPLLIRLLLMKTSICSSLTLTHQKMTPSRPLSRSPILSSFLSYAITLASLTFAPLSITLQPQVSAGDKSLLSRTP